MSDKDFLYKAMDQAKSFQHFDDVLLAISLHPEWLTLIPEDRKWAILHQIILSGDVNHLNQVLALQKANEDFRLLTDTRDHQTVLSIAQMRKDIPEMKKRIEQLIKLDEMLSYARDGKWDRCYNIAKENPTYVNEKPPYRRCYLIHHMAFANAIEQFKQFQQIKGCIFNLTLRVGRKKANEIAREANHREFAEFIEKQYPSLLENNDSALDELSKPSEEAVRQTKAVTLMVQKSVVKDLDDDLLNESSKSRSRTELMQHLGSIRSEDARTRNRTNDTVSKAEDVKHKALILDNLTCPLTMNIFVDPVIAADGFTYERSAIQKWLKKNDLSPMTSQQLPNKDLNPNNVIKQIITAFQAKS